MKLKPPVKFFFRHLVSSPQALSLLIINLIALAALASIVPMPIKFIIDNLLQQKDSISLPIELQTFLDSLSAFKVLFLVSGMVILLHGLTLFLDYFRVILLAKTTVSMRESARRELIEKALKKTIVDQQQHTSADLVGRISQDVRNMNTIVLNGLPLAFHAIPSFFMVITIIISVNVPVALSMITAAATMCLVIRHYAYVSHNYRFRFREQTTRFEEKCYETVTGMALTKALRCENTMVRRLESSARQVSDELLGAKITEGKMLASVEAFKYILQLLILSVGGHQVMEGKMSIGSLALFLSYVKIMRQPIKQVAKFAFNAARSTSGIKRINDYLEAPKSETVSQQTLLQNASVTPFNGRFEFKIQNLNFSYNDQRPLFHNVEMTLESGQVVLVTGAAGSGKSTLLQLLSGLIFSGDGQFSLNDHGRKNGGNILTREWLQNNVILIPQGAHILNQETMRANLLLGIDSDVDDETLWQALDTVAIADCVRDLPNQLDAIFGQEGHHLSVGQMKKISLARAALRQKDIYFFDEPLAGLDPVSRDHILKFFNTLADQGALVIYTGPRLGNEQSVDQIFEIKNHHIGSINHSQGFVHRDC